MVVYKHKSKGPLKWLVAVIVFILAMTITWSDVSGIEVRSSRTTTVHQDKTTTVSPELYPYATQPVSYLDCYYADPLSSLGSGDSGDSADNEPAAMPEPGTLLLLIGGLGTLAVLKKKNISS